MKTKTESRIPQGTIKAKWPDPLWRSGFVAVARSFLRAYRRLHPPLSDLAAITVIGLVDYVWRDGQFPFPSPARLARDLGTTPKRIEKALNELEKSGYLVRKEREGITAYDLSNLYTALQQTAEQE
jgi:hypothetical protein